MNQAVCHLWTLSAVLTLKVMLIPEPASGSERNHPHSNNQLLLASASYHHPSASIPATPLIKIAYKSWLPKMTRPRLVLLCIHGLGLSSKSFDHFGNHMAAAGIPTYAIDVRGFGEWAKNPKEAHMDFEACLTDVELALKILHKAYPKLPVFLVGESMGGAIAIQAAARYPDQVNGLVSLVPSTSERTKGFFKSGMIVVFSTAKDPTKRVNMAPIIVDKATANPALRSKIKADPLNRSDLSKHELAQIEKFMEETHDSAPLVERTPALILEGIEKDDLNRLSRLTSKMELDRNRQTQRLQKSANSQQPSTLRLRRSISG